MVSVLLPLSGDTSLQWPHHGKNLFYQPFTLGLALWLALSSWTWIRETVLRLGLKRYQIFSRPLLYLCHCLRGTCSASLLGWGQWEKCGTPTSTDLQLKAEPFQLNYRSVRINNDCFKLLSLAWFVIQNYCGNRWLSLGHILYNSLIPFLRVIMHIDTLKALRRTALTHYFSKIFHFCTFIL